MLKKINELIEAFHNICPKKKRFCIYRIIGDMSLVVAHKCITRILKEDKNGN